jgi:single-strand DNA-binding protein
MPNLNHVVIMGHLGADPEVRRTESGTAVANLRIATNMVWKNKDGEKEQRTDWHQVVVWGLQGERCGEFLKKGALVLVTGRIQTREWTDAEGNRRWSTEIVAGNVEFIGRPWEDAA